MDIDGIPCCPTYDIISRGQLANLPTEIILEVAFYLEAADLCHYATITSRNWHILKMKCHREALRVALPTSEEYAKLEPYLTADEHMRHYPRPIQQELVKTDINERSKFVNAVSRGYVHAVRAFLNHGVTPNASNIYGNRALVLAGSCSVPVVMSQVLLAYGADPNLADPARKQFTPLYGAATNAQDGLEGVLQLLCHLCNKDTVQHAVHRGANLHQRDRAGNTVVHSSAKNGNPDILALLFNIGLASAYLEVRNSAGKTPLMKAVKAERLRNMSLLLKQGADPNATYTNGTTALHVACRFEFIGGAYLLLEAGANVNAISGEGKAPLHYAAAIASNELVRRLIQKGANISATDLEMNTPLHVACYLTDQRWLKHGEILELVKTLVSAGAPTIAQNVVGQTPLSLVLLNHQLELAHILITNNPHALDGETPSGREWSDYLRRHVYQSHIP
ncbi:hypothetical protein UA08_00701 [Talaromyces atroroseus]|uniref:Uncharacterized protein n=1 Tax=Talaromyces atroroseus TaxID=1441469 RepID=A0A225ATF8_TALAT|nr:hypothetical protein UA08_00701 [Talaromyces atroroseus]OKL64230.1 hypothetical protein UA08_00701 [Talaromyces atroroseus]